MLRPPRKLGEIEFEIGGRGHADDGLDARVFVCGGGGQQRQMSTGGVSQERDFVWVAFIFGGVEFDPANGGECVVETGGPEIFGSEAIVDAEPGEVGFVEGVGGDVIKAGFVARGPAAPVDEDGDGEWAGAVGSVGVELEALAVGLAVFDVGGDAGADGGGSRRRKSPG